MLSSSLIAADPHILEAGTSTFLSNIRCDIKILQFHFNSFLFKIKARYKFACNISHNCYIHNKYIHNIRNVPVSDAAAAAVKPEGCLLQRTAMHSVSYSL